MKAVLDSLKSYLGRFSEDRKPSNNQKDGHAQLHAGYGAGYGFPLLIRRSTGEPQEKKLSKTGPSSRRPHMHSRLISSEPNLSPSRCNKSPVGSIPSPALTEARIKVGGRSTHLRDCFVEMYSSRRAATTTHSGDQPFDRYSSEYYSCGKKRVQKRGSACEVPNVDCACSVDGSAYSSDSDTVVAGSSCAEDNIATQLSDFSILLAENKALCHCIGEATLNFDTNDDDDNAAEGANGKRNAGFCSQQQADEEESSPALFLYPARGAFRKNFPPPLAMLALQSYFPEAIASSHCLRSFRQDGRIVLQEVRAPIHKYFRVSREHGRLKLELISAADDSSQEDDERSVSDVCLGVKHPNETSTNGGGSDTGCGRTDERMSAYTANIVEMVKPLEQVDLAATDIQNRFKLDLQAENLSGIVDASADERMLGGKLLLISKVGAEDLASCFNESASSPRCVETTTVYDVPSARMKHSWVRPISAF